MEHQREMQELGPIEVNGRKLMVTGSPDQGFKLYSEMGQEIASAPTKEMLLSLAADVVMQEAQELEVGA